MISCRYVGNDCAMIGDREFDAVGQRAEFSEQGFKDAILGCAHFIPEADFKKCGFTNDELAKHGPSGKRYNPPGEFYAKLDMAQQIFRDIYSRMLTEGSRVLADCSDTRESEYASEI